MDTYDAYFHRSNEASSLFIARIRNCIWRRLTLLLYHYNITPTLYRHEKLWWILRLELDSKICHILYKVNKTFMPNIIWRKWVALSQTPPFIYIIARAVSLNYYSCKLITYSCEQILIRPNKKLIVRTNPYSFKQLVY